MKTFFLVYKYIVGTILKFNTFGACKFYPSCSEYSLLAVKKYGYSKGFLKTVKRIVFCSPLSKGGVDLP